MNIAVSNDSTKSYNRLLVSGYALSKLNTLKSKRSPRTFFKEIKFIAFKRYLFSLKPIS